MQAVQNKIQAKLTELVKNDGFFMPFIGIKIKRAELFAECKTYDDIKHKLFPEHVAVQEMSEMIKKIRSNYSEKLKEILLIKYDCADENTRIAQNDMENLLTNALVIRSSDCVRLSSMIDALLFHPGNVLCTAYIVIYNYLKVCEYVAERFGMEQHRSITKKTRAKQSRANLSFNEKQSLSQVANSMLLLSNIKPSREKRVLGKRKEPMFSTKYDKNGNIIFDGDKLVKKHLQS